jgi:serine/threonine protein kinase
VPNQVVIWGEKVPNDSQGLRDALYSCLPSLVIEDVAAQSGQRVVYFGHFEDSKIPSDVPKPDAEAPAFLHGWETWGRVVIKVVGGASPEALTRLQAETAILTELRPDNFPHLHYCNLFSENPVTDDPLPEKLYVSIEEFIVSKTLANCIAAYQGKTHLVIDLFEKIANALTPIWTHPKRFVHRDIKPENILIKPDGNVVIIDLGIVRETGGKGITQDGWGNSPLTINYAAPEQIRNDKDAISFKTDFFAMGILMYYLISQKHPFINHPNQSPYEIATAIEGITPPSLEEMGCADPLTSNLVGTMMQKLPYHLPRTPDLLINQLSKIKEALQK